jgi:hypothetical protein
LQADSLAQGVKDSISDTFPARLQDAGTPLTVPPTFYYARVWYLSLLVYTTARLFSNKKPKFPEISNRSICCTVASHGVVLSALLSQQVARRPERIIIAALMLSPDVMTLPPPLLLQLLFQAFLLDFAYIIAHFSLSLLAEESHVTD